jgi:hypothetical protein
VEVSRRWLIGAAPIAGMFLTACQQGAVPKQKTAGSINWSEFSAKYLSSPEVGKLVATQSPDGRALSVLFDHLLIELQSTSTELERVELVTGAFSVRIPSTISLVGYTIDVRGQIIKDSESMGEAIFELAGTSKFMEWPFGEQLEKPISDSFSSAQRSSGAQDDGIETVSQFALSVSLLAQRRSTKSSILIAIDSLDLMILSN